MKINVDKMGIVASYFSDNTEELYVTKLLKLFYYFDFISYKMRGSSVTGDVYVKLPYGPVPSFIKDNLSLLSAENIFGKEFKSALSPYIKLIKEEDGNAQRVVSTGKKINLRKLSNNELILMKEVAKTFKKINGSKLSDKTHTEKPWLLTNSGSTIDYELAMTLNVSDILPNLKEA